MRDDAQRTIAHRDLERLDEAQASYHRRQANHGDEPGGPVKDDRRSSGTLTDRERSERWPLG